MEALYKGKVILDGITQLRQFEIALRSLHSFGILLNLRPAVYFEDENNVDDLIKEVVEDADEDGKEEVVEESKKVEISNKEAGKPVRTSKRTRKETTAASTTEEDTTPKKRSRTTVESPTVSKKSKDEANKPNFKHVNSDLLNEKVKEGQIAFVKWLQKEGFLRKAPPECTYKDCRAKLALDIDEDAVDGVTWRCPKDENHPIQNIRNGSIFKSKSKSSPSDSLSYIIQIILCWSDNTSLMKCQEITGCQDVDKIFFWYEECAHYYGIS